MKFRDGYIYSLLTAAVCCVIFFSFYLSLERDAKQRVSEAWETAYMEGYNVADSAHAEDYGDGYTDGYDAGAEDGYSDGYDQGYNEGYGEAYALGYKEGFAECYNETAERDENGFMTREAFVKGGELLK